MSDKPTSDSVASILFKGSFGGVLMGLANLVPGISGGTMLLVSGIYPSFVDAIARLTRFQWKLQSFLIVGVISLSAALSILLFAGALKDLVLHQRWIMYSLFIGLTLGGLPPILKMSQGLNQKVIRGAIVGFCLMLVLALLQFFGVSQASSSSGWFLLFVAGLLGASAMILPGLSGGYLLLLLGQYVPILGGIQQLKHALKARDLSATWGPIVDVVIPVGIGIVIGIAVVSNAVKWLLQHRRNTTLGVLVGLLLGSVIGLFPFQKIVSPVVGKTVVKGQVVTMENLGSIKAKDFPVEYFSPSAIQILGSVGLILLGFAVTTGISRVDRIKSKN